MSGRSIRAITRTAFNTNILAPAYAPINANGLPFPCFLLRLVNESNTDITISFDGAVAHDFIRADSDLIIPAMDSLQDNGGVGAWRKGTKVYVSGGGAGVGTIYLCGYYLIG
jgi:hypothetical protein